MAWITEDRINDLVERVNKLRGIDKKFGPGAVKVGSAYDGHRVELITNNSGGVRALTEGYGPRREAYTYLRGMLAALDGSLNNFDGAE